MAPRVLIVDDEPQVRAVISHAFQLWEWECDEAEDGQGAVEALSDNTYELVVADLIMPRMSGLALIGEYQQKWSDTKLIAISGRVPAAVRAQLRQSGVTVVAKPFTLDQLHAAAEEALGQTVTPRA